MSGDGGIFDVDFGELLPANSMFAVRGRQGRQGAELSAEVIGELTEDEVILWQNGKSQAKPAALGRIRQSHHKLAQLLSSGTMSDVDAARMVGYTPQYVHMLRKDPAFSELLAHYSETKNEALNHLVDKLALLSTNGVEVLLERLELAPDKFSSSQLMELVKFAADRSDAPTKSSTQNLPQTSFNVNFINEIKNAVDDLQKGNVVLDSAVKSLPGREGEGC